jgi:Domain of unknown function (DUF1707)
MSHIHAEPGASLVRASDAERDQAAGLLRAAFAEGRLTRAELDERLAAVYAAKTRADLRDLTGDLPGAIPAEMTAEGRPLAAGQPVVDRGPGASVHLNLCLLLCLLFCFPPAGVAFGIYWIVTARRRPRSDPRSPVPGRHDDAVRARSGRGRADAADPRP